MNPNQLWRMLQEKSIDGKYHLKQFLGAGVYGGVFLADEVVDDYLQREVAVKLMSANDDPNNEQELEIALQHPHAVQCFASGKWTFENGQYLYLVMELAEETLAQHLQNRGGILPEEKTWDVVESLGSALVYFSESSPRLVHRDLKPANVLRVGDSWKIADFGIVRFVEGDIRTTTRPMATPAYAPPEFYQGIVSPAFDMWSLGVMIVEMLTGQLPFRSLPHRPLQVVVTNDEPTIISPLPSPFPEIVKGCLKKNHEQRLTAKQLEVQFIIPRLVQEVWKPETEEEKDQAKEAVKIVTMYRTNLKTKTKNHNSLLRSILKWTKFQHPLLTLLLKWVCDAPSIPTEGNDECIAELVRSHIKDWTAQELAKVLDFDAPANSFWRGLEQNPDKPLALVDYFIARQDFPDLGTIQKISNIIDDYSGSISTKNRAEGQTNFQRLIVAALKSKFSQVKKKIDRLLREIKQWNAQELANYLEANAPANSFWLRLKQEYDNPFALVDDFLARPNLADEEKIKKIKKIIDKYRAWRYNGDGIKVETNFQRLILDSLETKFSEVQKTMAQAELDQLLNSIVEDSPEIEAIAIISLTKNGGIEYNNKKLKSSKPEIYQALFGRRDASDAIAEFDKLPGIPKAFKTFGEVTSYGTLEYAMFYMTQGLVIVYFLDLPDIPVGICFISTQEANFAPFCRQCNKKIKDLQDKVKVALQEV